MNFFGFLMNFNWLSYLSWCSLKCSNEWFFRLFNCWLICRLLLVGLFVNCLFHNLLMSDSYFSVLLLNSFSRFCRRSFERGGCLLLWLELLLSSLFLIDFCFLLLDFCFSFYLCCLFSFFLHLFLFVFYFGAGLFMLFCDNFFNFSCLFWLCPQCLFRYFNILLSDGFGFML